MIVSAPCTSRSLTRPIRARGQRKDNCLKSLVPLGQIKICYLVLPPQKRPLQATYSTVSSRVFEASRSIGYVVLITTHFAVPSENMKLTHTLLHSRNSISGLECLNLLSSMSRLAPTVNGTSSVAPTGRGMSPHGCPAYDTSENLTQA